MRVKIVLRILPVVLISFLALSSPLSAGAPANKSVILATTTSTQDSGLLDLLIPVFEKTGYIIKTIAVGTGQALAMGKRGDADVLLTHAPAAEMPLVEEGWLSHRVQFMHNDFIVVGPESDPAKLGGLKSVAQALRKIAERKAAFISRGDDSGTHKMEKELWRAAGIEPGGGWHIEAGQGMGATLRIASEKSAYTLTDRSTYLNLRKTLALKILLEGDPPLLNRYSVMLVNPAKHPRVNSEGGRAFHSWLLSDEALNLIKGFGKDRFGQSLFFLDPVKQ